MVALALIGTAVGLGTSVAGGIAQADAADASKTARVLDWMNRLKASELEFDKLDIGIAQLTREAKALAGTAEAAIAGAGAGRGGATSAQARAITFGTLARDIAVSRLNTDIATTALGFGPGTRSRRRLERRRGTAPVAVEIDPITPSERMIATLESAGEFAIAESLRARTTDITIDAEVLGQLVGKPIPEFGIDRPVTLSRRQAELFGIPIP